MEEGKIFKRLLKPRGISTNMKYKLRYYNNNVITQDSNYMPAWNMIMVGNYKTST